MTGLKHVQCATHVTLAQPHQATHGFWLDADLLLFDHLIYQRPDVLLFQGAEAEASTPGQQSR